MILDLIITRIALGFLLLVIIGTLLWLWVRTWNVTIRHKGWHKK